MQNTVKYTLSEQGLDRVRPTKEKVQWLCGTPHRFTKILNNKTEMTASELYRFAEWLRVDVSELVTQ